MKDVMFGLYEKCPECKSKRLYYCMTYPLEVMCALNGKPFISIDGKRKYIVTKKDKAKMYERNLCDFLAARCVCEKCNWISEAIIP